MEHVCRSADLICATTNSSTALWEGAWLKPSAHVNAIGSYTPEMQEVDAATMTRSWVVLDEPGAAESSGDVCIPLAAGAITQESNGLLTLGSLLLMQGPGSTVAPPARGGSTDCTLFKSVGVAVQDVSTAAAAVARAEEMGIGTKAQL